MAKRVRAEDVLFRSPTGEEFEIDGDGGSRVLNDGIESVVADENTKLLATKEGEMFLYADAGGNLRPGPLGMGLYFRDTRFLSMYALAIAGRPPVLLSSSAERAYMSYVDLTNPDLWDDGEISVTQQTLNIRRIRVISGRFLERIRFKNYNEHAITVPIELSFAADFADIFEVRGLRRKRHGQFFKPKVEGQKIVFGYRGEDEIFRQTRIDLGSTPDSVTIADGVVTVEFRLDLVAHQTKLFSIVVEPVVGEDEPRPVTFDGAVHELRRSYEEWERDCTTIYTDNELFNTLLHRGQRDLRALVTETTRGKFISAGIPWYVAAFGRDALLTSHQILMLNAGPARDSLRVLAAFQGRQVDRWRDEEPGKILHEIRQGELSNAFYVPHSPYYGSVDSTPLFLMLLGTYFRWTNDRAFVQEMMPNVEAALTWIDEFGDADGDGFVEYQRHSPRGLDNQGWKDSHNSIVHADGTLAAAPIALAEVQAYVYCAKQRIADVFEAFGNGARAAKLRDEAVKLKSKFNDQFWIEEDNFYAMALDGNKEPVRTVSSNPAHGLYCEILEPDHAALVAERLLQPDMFSGWGVRTMSKTAVAYNPMSYHNGSVWPHDNAFIAAGLKRYGFHRQTNRIATAIFDAAIYTDYMRLPELFCGFTRRTPNSPVAYPVACSPQAWAAGSPFLLLQAMLGLSARAHENVITVNNPVLPPWLNTVELRNLRVGDSTLSLAFRREGEMTSFSMLSKDGPVRVIMEEF
ncbi:MAG: glycogen debranching N-terminal domain-containing protein [Actinomycetota bacterium]|nr:amylo-alpha-1,6-glucosidase [Actinomycetota bacterium]